MQVLRRPGALSAAVERLKRRGTVGFVPTMGALHEGHLSLVRLAHRECDGVVASIFVNPTQFGPKEDLARYPRPFAKDRRLLARASTDILFAPSVADIYPRGFQTRVSVEKLAKPLCGRTRPVHFAGVATVVLKLLNLVRPDRLYLGQKDYQQWRLVEQMALDLDLPVKVRRAPIVREPDGLAMSSRNVFLSQAERTQAPALYRTLKEAAQRVREGRRDPRRLAADLKRFLKAEAPAARIDYLEIVDARTLENVLKLKKGKQIAVALAAYFSKARLIDNILIKV